MAINSNEKCERSQPSGPDSISCSKLSNISSCRLLKTDNAADSNSSNTKQNESKKKKSVSPYLTEDRIQLLSKITEKRLMRKKTTDFVSSFPLAINIYKANSDEFKSLKKSKKVKKSVLTLPNEPAPLPQMCTVSDMNDSEYFNEIKDEKQLLVKKRRANRKPRIRSRGIEIFDRDARYCSQLNINLDSSSTDMINQFTGDAKKKPRKRQNNLQKHSSNAHDVWAMLRNMNRFPFRPSPPVSQDSVESIKKIKNPNKHRSKNTKFIETCRTEEFTYITSLLDKTSHHSLSSIDRITVIDKQDDYQEINEELKFLDNKLPSKEKNQRANRKPHTKSKLHARTQQKNVRDESDNDPIFHKFKNQKPPRNLYIENKVQSQDNKLTDHTATFTDMVSNHENIYCQHNINNSITNNDNLNDCEDSFGGNSDSSNGGMINNLLGDYEDHNKFDKLSPSESQLQINGITKVVLSKGENILLTKKAESLKRKPRLGSTLPSTVLIPKLTKTEIKRRLAKIKYPLIILTREQVSSTVEVTNYQPPQFAGLEEHIWPFMQNWRRNNHGKDVNTYIEEKNQTNEKTFQSTNGDGTADHKREIKNKIVINGTNNVSGKYKRNKYLASNDKSIVETIPKTENINNKGSKSKPIRQFKDRMLQFLYKKSSTNVYSDNKCFSNEVTKQRLISDSLVDVGVNTSIDSALPIEQYEFCKRGKIKYDSYVKQPLAKGRWTSDFIENIIKKIKSGVYYNQDEKYSTKDSNLKKDDFTQTEVEFNRNDCCQSCKRKTNSIVAINETQDPLGSIPGFDDSLSELQIESINQKQIAIKHCVTNIVVEFDVALPSEINRMLHLKKSISCIPVAVTESQTKIFKSETIIINAKLPAELCSILPKIMRNIINSRVVLPKIVDKVDSNLSTIAELTRCESRESFKPFIPFHIDTSHKLRNFWHGTFSDISLINSKNTVEKICFNSNNYFNLPLVCDLLPNVNISLLLNYQIRPNLLNICKPQRSMLTPEKYIQNSTRNMSNMQLQIYPLSKRQVVPAYRKFDLINLMIDISNKRYLNPNIIMPLINNYNDMYRDNNITICSAISTDRDKVSRIDSEVKEDSLYNGLHDHTKDLKQISKYTHKYVDYLKVNKSVHLNNGVQYCTKNIKNKKIRFIKPHKKCKSMSSISNERSTVALNKIKNFEDFFLALGSAKTLACVFDGNVERKILTSVKEMNNWISDITPRQAMLVLLLATKKDTSNLVRYRPVILQGIAVNRITRASELDMEIEVIERENINTFTQYEGIYYVPASVENHNTLLEELHWIAKTTASDYQRPYDESSERLLRSLLEKRRKLNPSYLRVMARYVGLGLLKPPK